jgi:putative PIN family toxin of toxin-antitoxin system
MISAVLDSNVYISALLFGGNPRRVVDLAHGTAFSTFLSQAMVDEIEDVLRRKFQWSEVRIRAAGAATWRLAARVNPSVQVDACPDPDDNRVLECAIACQAHFIVTGDHHLLDLQSFRGITIINSRQFLEIVRNDLMGSAPL